MKRIAHAVALLVALTAPAWAGFDEGLAAYDRGDYATVLREWRPLGEQGNAVAQFFLGFMYGDGQGVPHDYAEAVKWYRRAAEQDHADAQNNLGFMYDRGRGVSQDYVEAVKWFRLAAEQGHAEALRNRDIIAESLTPAQIAEAEKLAREWYPKKQKLSRQGAAVSPRAPFDGYWSGKLNCYNRPWWTLRDVVIRDGKLVIKKEPTQQQAALDISGEFDSEGRIKLKGWADNSAGISQHLWIKAKGKRDRIEGWGMLDAADCVFSVGRD